MTKQKKANALLARMNQRLAGMIAIDPKLDLGGVSVSSVKKSTEDLKARIANVHHTEAVAGAARLELAGALPDMRDTNERILTGVATKFGKRSAQYKQVGGVPTSERKRPRRAKKSESKSETKSAPVAPPASPAITPDTPPAPASV